MYNSMPPKQGEQENASALAIAYLQAVSIKLTEFGFFRNDFKNRNIAQCNHISKLCAVGINVHDFFNFYSKLNTKTYALAILQRAVHQYLLSKNGCYLLLHPLNLYMVLHELFTHKKGMLAMNALQHHLQ